MSRNGLIMQTIQTRPSISEIELVELAARVKHFRTPFIDGEILSSLIKVVYYCGLKKAEILALNIGNIIDKKGKIRQNILDSVPITDQIKEVFRDHLTNLKADGYSSIKSSPLFPNRQKKRYGPRQLQYNLEKSMQGFADDIGLEKIRQSGICRFYERMVVEGRSNTECLQETMRFSRCTLRHVKGILKNKIIPAGRKKHRFFEYYKIIEEIEFGRNPTDENILAYRAQINNDEKLKPTEKSLLIKELHRVTSLHDPEHQ